MWGRSWTLSDPSTPRVLVMTREIQFQGTGSPTSLSTVITCEDTPRTQDHMSLQGKACLCSVLLVALAPGGRET
jgi:hypothetical protein